MRLLAALLLLLLYAGTADAHGIDIALRGSGDATVVFHYTDGSVMASAEYRIFAPGGGAFPVATGQTDAAGEVACTRPATDAGGSRCRMPQATRAVLASTSFAAFLACPGRLYLIGS